LLDLSASMSDRDMRPTRFDLSLEYAREFINEWFDQNPLGQIGIVGMRGGIGERVCEMSGRSYLCLVDDPAEDVGEQEILRMYSRLFRRDISSNPLGSRVSKTPSRWRAVA
jgi:hypothetical protein